MIERYQELLNECIDLQENIEQFDDMKDTLEKMKKLKGEKVECR